jgi:mycothiol system anti-sigma-R factor
MSRHRCEDAIANVYLYLDDEMGWVHAARISRHLRRCGSCLGLFRFEERLRVVIREKVREEPRPEVLERLQAFLREQEPGFGER